MFRWNSFQLKTVLLFFGSLTLLFLSVGTAMAAQVTLSWEPQDQASEGYRVYMRTEGQSYDYSTPVWPRTGDDPTRTTCVIENLADGTSYHFVVRAYAGGLESENSNEVNHVTQAHQFTITAATDGNGSLSPATAMVTAGGSQDFAIAADPGYQVVNVVVDGISVGPVSTYIFTDVNENHNLSAQFAPIVYRLMVSAGAGGSISPATTEIQSGGTQTVTIMPADGFQIADVTVDGISIGNAATYIFTNVDADHMIAASFEQVVTNPDGGNNTAVSQDTQNIWIEGEDGDIRFPMETAGQMDASAEGYVWTPETAGNLYTPIPENGQVTWRFHVTSAGEYVIWGRVTAPDSRSDSFFVAVDNGDEMPWHTRQSDGGKWSWDVVSIRSASDQRNLTNPRVYYLTQGDHTLTIKHREARAGLDLLLVTGHLGMDIETIETMMAERTTTQIRIEAEDGDMQYPMQMTGHTDASAAAYVGTPETAGNFYTPSSECGKASYRFYVPTTGSYMIWGRVMTPNSRSDSFYIAMDSGDPIPWHTQTSGAGTWKWDVVSVRKASDPRNTDNPLVYHLTAGEHTLTVTHRESGAGLDLLLVTNRPDITTADLEDVQPEAVKKDSLIRIEAEDGEKKSPMDFIQDFSALGGGYLITPANSTNYYAPSPEAGKVTLRFNVPSAGDYTVWGRVLSPDSRSNSFYAVIDNGEEIVWHTRREGGGTWDWDVLSIRSANDKRTLDNPIVFHLTAGEHTITIQQRESGAGLDQIIVTDRIDMTIADLEPSSPSF